MSELSLLKKSAWFIIKSIRVPTLKRICLIMNK